MATFATPGTRSKRALMVQYAVIDIAIKEWLFDVMPMCIARPVAETGASITGGAAHVGRLGATIAKRSWTNCLARSSSVLDENNSSIDDN
jgi:hypothetical protein